MSLKIILKNPNGILYYKLTHYIILMCFLMNRAVCSILGIIELSCYRNVKMH